MASTFFSRKALYWSYQWKKLLPSSKMLNLPEIPVNTFIRRSTLSWWSKEAEWLTARLDKWLATYRGYTKLRTSRISRACQTMIQESDEDSTSSDDSMRGTTAPAHTYNYNYKRRCCSQPNSPNRPEKNQESSQETVDNKTGNGDGINPEREVDIENNEIKDPEFCDVKVVEEEYKRQFRQPYGWTDYTKTDIISDKNGNETSRKKTEGVKITRQNSSECCNSCCYEFCCDEKATPTHCAAHGNNNNNQKKRGPLEVISNKISQANRTCDKYFSFRRRHQVHLVPEDGFFTYRRRRSTYKATRIRQQKKRVVYGGTTDSDPMWPAVMLTFDRGVTPSQHMTIALTSMPETVL